MLCPNLEPLTTPLFGNKRKKKNPLEKNNDRFVDTNTDGLRLYFQSFVAGDLAFFSAVQWKDFLVITALIMSMNSGIGKIVP
jgi:hypothetical protein